MNYPILILCYQRTEELQKVLDSVHQLKPTKVYFHLHAAPDQTGQQKVVEVKALIEAYQGEKEVLYSEEPLGVRKSIYNALDWFLSKEPKGLVFEDDVVLLDKSAKEINALMDNLGDNAGIIKFGTNPERGVYWGWGINRNAWAMIKSVDLSKLNYESHGHCFEDKVHFLGTVELHKRRMESAFGGWDDEFHIKTKVLNMPIVHSSKPLTEHIGYVSTRVGNGIDKGFGMGQHVTFRKGVLVN
jgi:hypothetical protein